MRVVRLGRMEGTLQVLKELSEGENGSCQCIKNLTSDPWRTLYCCTTEDSYECPSHSIYAFATCLPPTIHYKYIERNFIHHLIIVKYDGKKDQHLPAVTRYSHIDNKSHYLPNKTYYHYAKAIQDRYRQRLKDWKTHAKIREQFLEWCYRPGRPGYFKVKEEFINMSK